MEVIRLHASLILTAVHKTVSKVNARENNDHSNIKRCTELEWKSGRNVEVVCKDGKQQKAEQK